VSEEPRIRDLYRQYEKGELSFEELIRAADRVLTRFDGERGRDEPPEAELAPGIRRQRSSRA
jgi:hypothetical protein